MKQRNEQPKHDSGKTPSSYDMQGGQSRAFHEENARNHELRERNERNRQHSGERSATAPKGGNSSKRDKP